MTKERILLVEDEPLVRVLLLETLLEAGFVVVEAGDADEALALLVQQERFDLLLTDVHMPGRCDGLGVAGHARGRQPELPVLFVTGRPDVVGSFAEPDARTVCLAKPFRLADLLRVLHCLLAGEEPPSL